MRMRKKTHGKERLSVLSALTVQPAPGEAAAVAFDLPRPLRLEIGCGKGDFICALSARDADYNYVAIEKSADVTVIALEKYAASRGLGSPHPNGGWLAPEGTVYRDAPWDIPLSERGNVRFLPGDAEHICTYFPAGSFDTIYANFSDPWPKARHAHRRLTSPRYLERYLRLLRPGGTFCFKTDNSALFDYSLETLSASPFAVTFVTRDLHHSERAADNIMTEYERNFSAKGFPIHMVEARKPEE